MVAREYCSANQSCSKKNPNNTTNHAFKAKEKYRGMFEIQKSGDKTSSGEIGLDTRTHASPKVGQDQVSRGVSVLCWHAAPVAYVLWKPAQLGKKSNSVIRSRYVMVKNCRCLVCSIKGTKLSIAATFVVTYILALIDGTERTASLRRKENIIIIVNTDHDCVLLYYASSSANCYHLSRLLNN